MAAVGLGVGIGLDAVDDGDDASGGPAAEAARVACVVAITGSDPDSEGGGVYHVATVAPDGSTTQHGGPDVTEDPVISPDGQRIAYIRAIGDYESAGPADTELWTMGIDGFDPAPIPTDGTRHGSPAWSPDGERLAFVRYADADAPELVTIPAAGGPATVVSRPSQSGDGVIDAVDWSPDGTRLAYLWHSRGPDEEWGVEVRTVPAEGGTPEVVATPSSAVSLDWAPDGATLLVTAMQGPDRGATVIDLPTGRTQSKLSGLVHARWAGDGTRVLGIRRADAPDGNERWELVDVPTNGGSASDERAIGTVPRPGGRMDVGPGC